jgi:hypothetical protein
MCRRILKHNLPNFFKNMKNVMEIANIIDTTPTTLLVWDSSSAIASIV